MGSEITPISNIMNKPIGIQQDKKISDAIESILANKIGRVIIFNEEKPVGIVSEKDILSFLFHDKLHQNIQDVPVMELMNDIYYVVNSITPFRAAKFMLDKKCSSVCIGSENNFEGIVTKTDLTKYYAENLENKKKISDYMTIHYFSVFTKDTSYEVMKTMLGFGISRMMIVSDEKQPVGVISTGDLFHEILKIEKTDKPEKPTPSKENENLSDYDIFCSRSAGQIMTKSIITVKADDDLAKACKIIFDEKINAVGVEDSDGTLGGIISKRDVLLALSQMS